MTSNVFSMFFLTISSHNLQNFPQLTEFSLIYCVPQVTIKELTKECRHWPLVLSLFVHALGMLLVDLWGSDKVKLLELRP